MEDFATIEAGGLDTETAYRLIIGCVVPRPIAWITTADANGAVNAAPFSSYNYVAHSPPMLAVNIGTRDGELKDTARNIEQSGEFVVNVPTLSLLDLMHQTSAEYPAEESEPAALGIELLASRFVKPPRIAVSPIQMECRLGQVVRLGRGLNNLYIGEVLAFHLSTAVFDGRRVHSEKLQPIGRLAGPNYTGLGEIVSRAVLQRPPKDRGIS